jgi:hypothetical protein
VLGIGILTDFQEFSVYDCRIPPGAGDKANKARVDYYTFDEYVDVWEEIEDRFGREAVLAGALDEYIASLSGARGKQRVDRVFLGELETWRSQLAVTLAKKNSLSQHELNAATQLIIDRVVFLRICEDRGIETYGELRDCLGSSGIYERLLKRFARADERYNSGLFHFEVEKGRGTPDTLTPGLVVPDEVLAAFIKRLYWPDGPYDFSVFPPDVLGQVYEQFLGSVIRLKTPKSAMVEEKPEVRKAGGVFYTPTHVVKDIVADVLDAALEKQTPESLTKSGLYICDPACGSGSFLIEVYQDLLDWHLNYYTEHNPQRWTKTRPRRLQKDVAGDWRLSTAERKRILLAHVYGVDIDAQAVEVTKLALLLKVLEGESEASLHEQFEFFHERVLPDLEHNIRCGNSLVGNAFHFSAHGTIDDELERKVNAFDWPDEFAHVGDGRGFDVIVGNPPWLMAGYYVGESVPYLKENFNTATGKFDLYYLFLEQSLRLLAPGGRLGMIVPNKFFHTRAAAALRTLLATQVDLSIIKDFGVEKVFEGATNYSCIVIAQQQKPSDQVRVEKVTARLDVLEEFDLPHTDLIESGWHLQDAEAKAVYEQMDSAGTKLEALVERFGTGVQSGSDTLLTFTREDARRLKVEGDLLRPLLRGRDVRAFQLGASPKLLLFPYRGTTAGFQLLSRAELEAFPNAHAYLQKHKKRLQDRVWFGQSAKELSGGWYGLMYVEASSTFACPHLLTPSLSGVSNFALGDGSLFATGTAGVTAVVPKAAVPESIEYLLAVLNSRVVSLYITEHSPIYQGGFHKFSAPYLKTVPIPRLDLSKAEARGRQERIVGLVKEVTTDLKQLRVTAQDAEQERLRRRIAAARRAIDTEVEGLYGLTDDQVAWIGRKMSGSKTVSAA